MFALCGDERVQGTRTASKRVDDDLHTFADFNPITFVSFVSFSRILKTFLPKSKNVKI